MPPLSLLMLEDSPLDAELARAQLDRAGIAFTARRVDSREDFRRAIEEGGFDLILADYYLPTFSGREALEMARRIRPEVPFIFVSGALGEETAIESLKEGATDYVLKQRLDRLAPAITRALAEVREKESRRAAERALADSREHNRLVLESVRDCAIITLDLDGRVATWNPGAEAVFGYREEEILGRPWSSLSAAGGDPAVGVAVERRYLRRSGEEFWGSGSLRPILDHAGTHRGYVQVLHDMTERKRFEEALREADRRKDAFLVMLAHELRNPLAAINSAAQLMCRSVEPRSVAWAGSVVERQVKHLAHMVDDLLDVSRISRGTILLRPERLDPAEPLRQAIEAVRPAIEDRGQTLVAKLPDEAMAVALDRTRFEQVVVNLLANASKYTPAGGRVDVTARREGGDLVVEVTDTGVGIAPELIGPIFQPFVQADQGIDRRQGGLGLGLTLARDLARLHGGSLTAESRRPRAGQRLHPPPPRGRGRDVRLGGPSPSAGRARPRRRPGASSSSTTTGRPPRRRPSSSAWRGTRSPPPTTAWRRSTRSGLTAPRSSSSTSACRAWTASRSPSGSAASTTAPGR